MLAIEVTDTGRGIEEQDLECIFERLRQTCTDDSEVQGGLGIGLYLCREFADLHGGSVVVESTRGVGSTFTVRLPLDGPEDPLSLGSQAPRNATGAPHPDPFFPVTA